MFQKAGSLINIFIGISPMKLDSTSLVLIIVCFYCAYQHWLIQSLQSSNDETSKHVAFLIKQHKSGPKSEPNDTQSQVERKHVNKSPPPSVPKFDSSMKDTKRSSGGGLRTIYGGAGDEVHLGGFTPRDNNTISYNVWNFLLGPMAVRSMLDVGCGRGFSTKYFKDNGAKVLCIEGSHDAIIHSNLERSDIIQHDYSKGVWWPEETYDIAWSTEFLEHLGRQHTDNYMATFKQAALIFVTSSGWGGYHHVEVHHRVWWVTRFQGLGLVYSEELSQLVRNQVTPDENKIPHGQILGGIMVFINPAVMSLPKHAHLMGGHGCYRDAIDNLDNGEPCKDADALPLQYQSLLNCKKDLKDGQDALHFPWICEKNRAFIKKL